MQVCYITPRLVKMRKGMLQTPCTRFYLKYLTIYISDAHAIEQVSSSLRGMIAATVHLVYRWYMLSQN